MELSNKNAIALLLDLNQDIEEYAEATIKNIVEDKNFDFLTYPPNYGLTDLEKAELNKLDNSGFSFSSFSRQLTRSFSQRQAGKSSLTWNLGTWILIKHQTLSNVGKEQFCTQQKKILNSNYS